MRRLLIALAVLLAMPVAEAQPRRGVDTPAPAVDRREAIKKRIRAMRAYALTEELALDEATAGKLFPVLAKWDDVTDRLLVTRVDLTKRLREVDQLRDAKSIDRLIDEAIANQKAFWELEEKRLAELRKILSPAQVAKLVVVLPEFERKIQNQLKRAIAKRGGRAGAARRGGDDEDFDGDLDEELPAQQPPRSGPARRVAPTPAPDLACDPFSVRGGCPPKR